MQPINQNEQITPRQLRVLKVIARFQDKQCYSATIAEIAEELSLSRTTVFGHIATLLEKKLLTKSRGKARSLRLTQRGRQLLDFQQQSESIEHADNHSGIAMLGRVAAGLPIEAIENRDRLTLTNLFGNFDDVFSLQVAGDSMIDEGINDGDFVICKRRANANNGELVVALVNDEEVTVKRFYKETDGIRLQPANDAYEPIYCDDCRIEAVVIGLVHKY